MRPFSSVHPELCAEWSDKNLPLKPTDISYGSNKTVWWIGACGHEWQASVKERSSGAKCPICSNAKIVAGINDLQTLFPDLALEWSVKNAPLTASMVAPGSHKKAYWKGKCGHEWCAQIKSRAYNHAGCPYCSHALVLPGSNDLATLFPDIAKEWSRKNLPLKPTDVTAHVNKMIWWKCEKGHEWKTLISTRTAGSACPYCSGARLLKGFNDFATTRPELAREWSEKNDLKPDAINEKSRENVLWECCQCGYEWKAVVRTRVLRRAGCPVCRQRVILDGYNDLVTTDPELVKEWDYEKNTGITPNELSRSSMRVVWWKCDHGHSWREKVCVHVIEGGKCKICKKEFEKEFHKALLREYAEAQKIEALFDTDEPIGVSVDVYFPEYKTIVVSQKGDSEKEKKRLKVIRFLCEKHQLHMWICTPNDNRTVMAMTLRQKLIECGLPTDAFPEPHKEI